MRVASSTTTSSAWQAARATDVAAVGGYTFQHASMPARSSSFTATGSRVLHTMHGSVNPYLRPGQPVSVPAMGSGGM